MSNDLREALIAEGVDYNTTLERFMGKEDLYHKFLIKFLDDDNFNQLEGFLNDKKVEEAFKCAHTIKGLCGNLGFENLLEVDIPLVEILRAGSLESVDELFEDLKKRYDSLCDIIKKYS